MCAEFQSGAMIDSAKLWNQLNSPFDHFDTFALLSLANYLLSLSLSCADNWRIIGGFERGHGCPLLPFLEEELELNRQQ